MKQKIVASGLGRGNAKITIANDLCHQRGTDGLLPPREACYKCNMRRWMRDRGKRRKPQGEKPGQENPAPLQPKFPDPTSEERDRDRSPILRRSPTRLNYKSPSRSPRLAVEKSRRSKGATATAVADVVGVVAASQCPRQPPALPRPGGPTGEAAEAEVPSEAAEPAAPSAGRSAQKPKGAVVLSIGLPGSGKSTWFKRHNILPLSSDMVRILLFDDVTEQRYQDLVFSTLRTMLRARLLARRPWNYLDATNLSPHERRSWIKLAHDFGYEAHAVFFDVPPEVCMERNHRRERNVPEDVMQRMANKLRPPKFEEGFAKITVVRLKKEDGEAIPAEEPRQEFAIEPDEGEPPEVMETTE